MRQDRRSCASHPSPARWRSPCWAAWSPRASRPTARASWLYDFGGLPERPDRAVHHRVELAEFPFGPDASRLLRSAGRARGLHLDAADPAPRGLARPVPFRGGAADRATRHVLHGGRRRTGRDAPAAGPLGDDGAALGGGGLLALAIVIVAIPAVPAGTVSSSQPIASLRLSQRAPGSDLHGVHLGRLLGGPPPGHLRRRAHRSLRRAGAHRVHRR